MDETAKGGVQGVETGTANEMKATQVELQLALSWFRSRRLALVCSARPFSDVWQEAVECEKCKEVEADRVNELSIGHDLLDSRWD